MVKIVKSKKTQKYFSNQTVKQIEIGMDVVDFAIEEGETIGKKGLVAVNEIQSQQLNEIQDGKSITKNK